MSVPNAKDQERSLDANFIKKILAYKYRRAHGWAFFEEFYFIDGYAVGFQSRNAEILSFEIKISRQDFLKDIKVFHEKQKKALEVSNKFYYVCPWGLIEKHEVPDFVGLQYVDSANTIKIKKLATYRSMKEIPFRLLQDFAWSFGATVNVSDVPLKFLGKDVTQQEFEEHVNKKIAEEYRRKIEDAIWEKERELERKRSDRDAFIQKLRRIVWDEDEKKFMRKALRYCELGKVFSERYPLKDRIRNLKKELDRIERLVQDHEQLKIKKF